MFDSPISLWFLASSGNAATGFSADVLNGASNAELNTLSLLNTNFAGSNEDFVDSLYNTLLGRASDAPGKAFWLDELKSGVSRGTLLDHFLKGVKGDADIKAAATSVANFVESVYQNYMGRASDAPGKAFWLDALNNGASIAQVFDSMLGAAKRNGEAGYTEALSKEITNTYLNLLGREPEPEELSALLNSNVGINDIAANVANSATGSDATCVANKAGFANSYCNGTRSCPQSKAANSSCAGITGDSQNADQLGADAAKEEAPFEIPYAELKDGVYQDGEDFSLEYADLTITGVNDELSIKGAEGAKYSNDNVLTIQNKGDIDYNIEADIASAKIVLQLDEDSAIKEGAKLSNIDVILLNGKNDINADVINDKALKLGISDASGDTITKASVDAQNEDLVLTKLGKEVVDEQEIYLDISNISNVTLSNKKESINETVYLTADTKDAKITNFGAEDFINLEAFGGKDVNLPFSLNDELDIVSGKLTKDIIDAINPNPEDKQKLDALNKDDQAVFFLLNEKENETKIYLITGNDEKGLDTGDDIQLIATVDALLNTARSEEWEFGNNPEA